MQRQLWARSRILCAALALASCTGGVEGETRDPKDPAGDPKGSGGNGGSGSVRPPADLPGRGAGPGEPPGTTPPSNKPAAADDGVGPSPIRRLSRLEYNNTVRDLLDDASRPADAFAGDLDAFGAGYVRGGAVSAVDADQLMEAAEKVGAAAVKKLPSLLPCSPVPSAADAQDKCARDFIARFGRRAFRRPLTAGETDMLAGYYTKVRTELRYDFPEAIRMVVQVVLQSPSFLYRWELGPNRPIKEGTLVRFNDHEMASRLSYALWASMPDDALFAAADAGQLKTAADVEKQARRMLADPKAKDMLADFGGQWLVISNLLNVSKDQKAYPTFSPELARSMEGEAREFLGFVLGSKGDGKLETLLTAPFSFVDGNLAKVYQLTGVTGTGLRQTPLDATKRAGLFTQTAFLTKHAAAGASHPVLRGKEILERFLCVELPVPPANIPELPPPAANVSTRERFDVHGKAECARACHEQMDPLGFAFEHFDGIGMFRANDGGKPVDASGSIKLGGATKSFSNAVELTKQLAVAPEVRECATKQFLRYALKRRELPGDAASLAFVAEQFARSGYDMRELLVAVTKSRSFFYRQPAAGEVPQ